MCDKKQSSKGDDEMKKIRWGIAGPGAIAHKFAKAVKNVDCAELVAVASRSEQNARSFADKYDIPLSFCGYENMAVSDKVDAVYISTPHPFHISCAELFMKHGKHVLCEKPLCVNASQAEYLKKCASDNGVFLMEAMWTRFLPAVIESQRLVSEGIIGDIKGIEADFCYSSSPEQEAKLFQNHMAGGSLLDVGVYGLHFVSMFLGSSPQTVAAVADVSDGADLHTNVLLKYQNGALASVSSAIDVYKPESAYIYGTDGYMHFPLFYGANEFYIVKDGKREHICKPSMGEGLEEEIIEVCRCIASGDCESKILPLDETIAVIKLMDKIREQINLKYPHDADTN